MKLVQWAKQVSIFLSGSGPVLIHTPLWLDPPADSISADAERLAAVNEGSTKPPSKANLDPAQQSKVDRFENFEQAAENVAPKMAARPDKVTPEYAAYLQSCEQRAFGEESQGGIASQAKSMADQNVKKGNV